MANQELERVINELDGPRFTRRQFLKWGGLTALGAAGLGGVFVDLGVSVVHEQQVDASFDETYPPAPEDINRGAIQYEGLQARANNLADNGNLDAANDVIRSEEYARANMAYIQREAIAQARDREYQKALDNGPSILRGASGVHMIPALGFFFAMVFTVWKFSGARKALWAAKEAAKKRIASFHPEWLDKPPGEGEVILFDRAVSYLAPTGGKIPLTEKGALPKVDGEHRGILPPTYTAEEQIDRVMMLKREGELGQYYIHQLSVQGRLPDRFKFAAIALILNSPFKNNWEKPLFEAHWGKIAPLVHDGGNVQTGLNPLWRGVKGRTDFLQRVSIVQEPQLDELEKLRVNGRRHLPVERQVAARQNQLEEKRLRLENRFYQRVAFALHAENKTAPSAIPHAVVELAAVVWRSFEDRMRALLQEYGVEGVGEVTWFMDKPVEKKGWYNYGKRQEAEWPPIQQKLIKLEKVRTQYPVIREKARRILQETTDWVDRIIGLGQA